MATAPGRRDLGSDFDAVSLRELRERKSEKWNTYPKDVLPAFVAEMDFKLAEPIRRALHAAVDRSDCGYASPRDLPRAFAGFAADRLRWTVDEQNVLTVPDVMAGVAQGIRFLTKPGAGVVVNPPVYPPYFEVIPYAGRAIVEVPLLHGEDGRYSLDFDALERAFAAGAQAYLLCSPHNPVGRVWTASELQQIAALAKRYNVAIISDEIFAPLVMPDREFTALFSTAPDLARSCALTSASKAWNIAGLKCAVLIPSSDVAAEMSAYLKDLPTEIESRIGHLGVIASIAAFAECRPWLDELVAYLDGNRKLFGELLRQHLPSVRYTPPDATYLAWVDCSNLGLDNPAKECLRRGKVALERGPRFGTGGNSFVRVNMGTSSAVLREIVQRMGDAIGGR